MAKYRKLGRTSDQRKALLRNQVTNLMVHGKIRTTETKAKEVSKIAEGLIALAVREKDDYETVTVKVKVPQKDADGKRVKEVKDGKKVTVYTVGGRLMGSFDSVKEAREALRPGIYVMKTNTKTFKTTIK